MPEPSLYPELKTEFWEQRYQERTDRWDLGQPAPPFVHLLNSADAPTPGRMIVLGSGNGHDALLFAKHGFEVIGIDFAPSAIAHAQAAAHAEHLTAKFIQRDIFELANDWSGQFDYVLEHTCFCAIAPHQRSAYVSLAHELLCQNGELIGLFWAHSKPGGPPFGTTPDEIRDLFSQKFQHLNLHQATNSVPSRAPDEYLGRFVA
ncbi:MAG: methyltransferase domain-containing protein [Cyanobacteria bacterium P01_E01_bin.6]